MPYFFSRLIPPRPSFLADMTQEERAAMLAHQDYWLPHVNAGLVVAMGPVADPQGAYGVMIVNAPSQKMLEDWQGLDPVALAGLNFVFQNFPMPSIRVARQISPSTPRSPASMIAMIRPEECQTAARTMV